MDEAQHARVVEAARHNAALRPILKTMLDTVRGDPIQLMVLLETVSLGAFLLCVTLGGDEPVLEAFTDGLRQRLAEHRLGAMDIEARA